MTSGVLIIRIEMEDDEEPEVEQIQELVNKTKRYMQHDWDDIYTDCEVTAHWRKEIST